MYGPTAGRRRNGFSRLTEFACRRAKTTVFVSVVLAAAAFLYTRNNLGVHTNTADMISPDAPFRRHYLRFQQAFPQSDSMVVAVIDAPTPEGAGEAADRLAARLRERGALYRRVRVPGADSFFERNGLLFLGTGALSRLADRLASAGPMLAVLAGDPSLRGLAELLEKILNKKMDAAGEEEIAALMDRMAAVAEAQREGRIFNLSWRELLEGGEGDRSGRRRFVIVQPALDYGSFRPAAAALEGIRQAADALGIDAGNGYRMRLTGSAALEQEELESVKLGGKATGVYSFLLVAALLVAGLRSVRLVLATVATLLMGLVWTAAFAAFWVGKLNLISVAFAVLFIGLGVDFGIHMSLRYREEAASGGERAEALRRSAAGVGGALALNALSAAAGFYSFLPTDYRGLAELGLIAGTGMFIAFVANLTVLPALLALFPLKVSPPSSSRWTPALSEFLWRRGRAILAASVVLGLAGAAAVPYVRFDFNPMNLRDPRSESVVAFLDLAREPRTSPYAIQVLAADRDAAGKLAARLRKLPEVDSVVHLEVFVPENQEEKLRIIEEMAIFLTPALDFSSRLRPPDRRARRAAFARVRARLAAAARGKGRGAEAARRLDSALGRLADGGGPSDAVLASLERRMTTHLPRMLKGLRTALSAERVRFSNLPAALRRRWLSKDGRPRLEVRPAAGVVGNRELARFAGAVQAVAPEATGPPVIFIEAGKEVVRAFREASVLALFLIAAILIVVLRRLLDVVLVLVPLFLAALWTAGLSVLFGLSFNFANIIVLPLLLGLGVSSGVHLVLRQREKGEGARLLASSVSRGVIFSALTTIAAFGSLGISSHRGMASMGVILTIAIASTLLATLVVLPSLLAVATRGDDGSADGRPPGGPGAASGSEM